MLNTQTVWKIVIALFIGWMAGMGQSWALPAPTTIVGKWQTIDDETGKPRGIVQIDETSPGTWQGKLIKVNYRAGESEADLCTKCTDAAHKDKRILGMTFLWGMQQTAPSQWDNGYILDPHNGEIYHCKMTLDPNGQILHVRGYIGISLLGRTQEWIRIDNSDEN